MKKDKRFTARGRVVIKEEQKGVFGLRVVIFDKDHVFDDQLGNAITNDEGDFILQYRERDFRDLFEKAPDLYIKVLDCKGDLIHSSEDAVVWDAGQTAEFTVAVSRAKLGHHLKNMRPLPRLSGGVVAQEKLNVIDRAISLLDARGEIGPTMPLGSRPFGPGGRTPIPFGAWYCPAPDIFVFGDILDLAWDVIDNDPRAVLELISIIETIIHRHEVRKPQQFAAASERWRTGSTPDTEALGKSLEAKKGLLGVAPSETLIEKERYLPIVMATILAARGDRHVKNRYLGVMLGQLGALGQMDVIYRGAMNALRSNPGGIGSFRDLLGYVGGTCGSDDGPTPVPIHPEDIKDVDEFWRIEKWSCTAEMDRALGQLHGESYEIHDVDWSDGCPGSPVVITGENFSGLFPERHRVLFTARSGWGTVEAAPADYLTDWTDTRIEVPLPEEAGPGPISLQIIDNFVTACGLAAEPARRGRGATFDFDGGAAYIRTFTADGGRGTIGVNAGDTINLRWVVVPDNANVDLEISRDPVVIPHNNLDTEDDLDINIPAGRHSATICTLTADNSCPQPAHVREITLNAYIDPELTIAGIEVTQAIQHFNITGDVSDNNSVRLAQGKHTMVRVYVDSGRRDGFDEGDGPNVQPNVTGQLTVTDLDTGDVETLSPINPTGSTQARPAANINRDELEHSLNFQLPLHLVSGRKELRVNVESESPYGDHYTAEDAVEVSFHSMGELKLVRILCTDNITGNSPTVAGWNIGRQGARTRYPLAHDGFPVFTAPGNVTISTNENLITEAGWDNLIDRLDDIADDYEDIGQVWTMAVPDDAYVWNGLGTSGGHPRFICKENLPASFAHELGHTQGIGHSQCPCAGCADDPGGIDGRRRLPADGRYHQTGINVYTYRSYPESCTAPGRPGTPVPGCGRGELMSYCVGPNGVWGNYQNRWPSVEFWDIIFDLYN